MERIEGKNNYPELLEDLLAKGAVLLVEIGLENAVALRASFVFVELIRREWSGQNLYIPKGQAYDLSQRDLEMWNRFNGNNRHQLMQEYGITEQRFYQIMKAVRARESKRTQPDLFGDD